MSSFSSGNPRTVRINGNVHLREDVSCVIEMLATFAKCDGVVSASEIQVIENFMRGVLNFSVEERECAVGTFRRAKDPTIHTHFESFSINALRLAKLNPGKNILNAIVALLIELALANGTFSAEEQMFVEECVAAFKLNENPYSEYKRSRKARERSGSVQSDAYENLGCRQSDSFETIRRKYRQLVKKYHPDVFAGKGVDEHTIRIAREKFEVIQRSYERIVAQRERKEAIP